MLRDLYNYLRKENNEMKEELAIREGQITILKTTAQNLAKENKEANEKIERLQKQIDELKQQLAAKEGTRYVPSNASKPVPTRMVSPKKAMQKSSSPKEKGPVTKKPQLSAERFNRYSSPSTREMSPAEQAVNRTIPNILSKMEKLKKHVEQSSDSFYGSPLSPSKKNVKKLSKGFSSDDVSRINYMTERMFRSLKQGPTIEEVIYM